MKAVILDIDKNEATVMTEGGNIIGIRNNGYDIGQEIILHRRKNRSSMKRITGIIAAAAAAIVITGGIGGYTYYTPYGTVSLDVNPSIEYTINRFDRVLDVTGINDDGDDILLGLDTKRLINSNIETAIEDTIEQIDAEGYFSDEDGNYVVLAANTKEDAHTDTLLTSLEDNVGQRQNVEPISFKVTDAEISEAHSQGVSPGKKIMVDRLEGLSGEEIDRGEWNRRSVRDIVNEYDRLRENSKMHINTDPTTPESGQSLQTQEEEDMPQQMPQNVPREMTEDQPKQPQEDMPQQPAEDQPKQPQEDMPQQTTENQPQQSPENMPQKTPDVQLQQPPKEELPQNTDVPEIPGQEVQPNTPESIQPGHAPENVQPQQLPEGPGMRPEGNIR